MKWHLHVFDQNRTIDDVLMVLADTKRNLLTIFRKGGIETMPIGVFAYFGDRPVTPLNQSGSLRIII